MARRIPKRADTDVWPDNPKEVLAWAVFLGVIIALVALWSINPFLLSQVESDIGQLGGSSGDAAMAERGDEILRLSRTDAFYLNRIFTERSHEIGYCGLLDGNRLQPWLADTVEANPTRLAFKTGNCPGGVPDATIHTHPSGNLGLSMQDRINFQDKGYTYMCIQGGELTTTPGREAKQLRCYKDVLTGGDTTNTQYQLVPVVIAHDDAGTE